MCKFFTTFVANLLLFALVATVRTYYRVAEHLFAVESSDEKLMAVMVNYTPFRMEEQTEEKPIFILRINQNGLLSETLHSTYHHIFTDNSEKDMPRIEVYRNDEQWLMRVSQVADSPICCDLVSNTCFSQSTLHIDSREKDVRFCIDNALMLMFAFSTAPLMTLEMHAAVVVKELGGEEMGYLFLGHSGTGKSTHARQWLEAFPDAWLLNDDNPILRVMEDGEVRVYGSPWSGKTPCYNNACAHVKGIVKLSQALHNKARVISLPEAYAYILSSSSGLKIDKDMADSMYNTIKHIITHVQCYQLDCLPNTEAAIVCMAAIQHL